MRNGHAAREARQRVASENAAERDTRSDRQQIERLLAAGHTSEKEITQLKVRIKKAKEKSDG